jgi:hypothetical protein
MSDYHKLLAREDAGARQNYDFDPRIAYHNQSSILREHMEPSVGANTGRDLENPAGFTGVPDGSHSDSNMVQAAPKMATVRRYVIVDAAQRDWTRFPNPYSNLTFTFGGKGDTIKPTPVYTNNPTYPSFALPPAYNVSFVPLPGAPNLYGFSYIDPKNGVQFSLSAYNSSLPRGNFITNDIGLTSVNSGDSFGTPNTPSNVTSIRLLRAILPQTQFVTYPIDPVFTTNASDTKIAVTSTPYNTFGTYPYLLFYLNEYRGQYYAPTEEGCKAFAVLTQCNRSQINFTLQNGTQFLDYTPWNNEGVTFQSPITSLQKLVLTVADPHGIPFALTQPDTLAIDNILLATNISGGKVYESRSTLICTTPAYKTFPLNQLRVGDRISFHTPTLTALIKNQALSSISKRSFAERLIGQTFPILQTGVFKLDPQTNTYTPASITTNQTTSSIDYFNVFYIPNFTILQPNGILQDAYPDAVDLDYSILNPKSIFGNTASIPILNVAQQPIFSFELLHMVPDTTDIGGTVVN